MRGNIDRDHRLTLKVGATKYYIEHLARVSSKFLNNFQKVDFLRYLFRLSTSAMILKLSYNSIESQIQLTRKLSRAILHALRQKFHISDVNCAVLSLGIVFVVDELSECIALSPQNEGA